MIFFVNRSGVMVIMPVRTGGDFRTLVVPVPVPVPVDTAAA